MKREAARKKSRVKTPAIKKIDKEEKKSGNIILLKDSLNNILMNFNMNFTKTGTDILKKFVTDERMINYNNPFFKTGNSIDNLVFKKIWYIT